MDGAERLSRLPKVPIDRAEQCLALTAPPAPPVVTRGSGVLDVSGVAGSRRWGVDLVCSACGGGFAARGVMTVRVPA